MNSQIAITFSVLIIAALLLDHFWLQLGLPVLAGKTLNHAIEYLAFWR